MGMGMGMGTKAPRWYGQSVLLCCCVAVLLCWPQSVATDLSRMATVSEAWRRVTPSSRASLDTTEPVCHPAMP